jgi:hypothetical protein
MPIQVLHLSRETSSWSSLLKMWGRLMDDWSAVVGRDEVAYWYGERPLTGLLASAVWRVGGQALEESEAARGPRRRPRLGRIDSYIILNHKWFQVEAKVAWPTSDAPKGLSAARSRLSKALSQAREQLETVQDDYYGHVGLALCYVVPELPWPKNATRPKNSNILDSLAEENTATDAGKSIVAWYAPPARQRPWITRPARKHYPGVLIVGNTVW